MIYPGWVGQSYLTSTPSVDAERCFNLYPEVIAGPGVTPRTPAKMVLRRKPGLLLQQNVSDAPGRGKFAINGRDFAVIGASFVELTSATTNVLRGTLAAGSSAVQFACNSIEIMIRADGKGYIFNLATNAFNRITASGFPSYCDSIASLDTYFVALSLNSSQFVISDPLSGLVWKAVNFGSSEEPDNAVAVAESHLFLWIFGGDDIVLFQDSGNPSFPFTRVPGSKIEVGLAAGDSIAEADNTLFWIGTSTGGPAIVYRADGFLPTRVSTHAVEEAMEGYPTVADAVSSVVQIRGHVFITWHFPSANAGRGAAWTYDISGGMWHEEGAWRSDEGVYYAPIERFHSYAFGKHLVADWNSGNIYELSPRYASDDTAPIRWLRAAPAISDENNWIFYPGFELDLQMGGGLPNNADPQVMIRWSDDGGQSYHEPRQVSCGRVGEFLRRASIWGTGRAMRRCFEASGTDPIPNLAIVNAYLPNVRKGVH